MTKEQLLFVSVTHNTFQAVQTQHAHNYSNRELLKMCENNVYKSGKAILNHFVHYVMVNRKQIKRIHSVFHQLTE